MSTTYRNWILVFAFFASMFLFVPKIFAADQPPANTYQPPAVSSIDIANTRYIFNQPKAGQVTAWDVPSGKKLWEKTLYSTIDVATPTAANHPVYIKSATLSGTTIKITSENNNTYTISTKNPNKPDVISSKMQMLYAFLVIVAFFVVVLYSRKWFFRRNKKDLKKESTNP